MPEPPYRSRLALKSVQPLPLPDLTGLNLDVYMDINRASGVTLLELLMALAVFAILVGVGVPSFAAAIKNSCMSSNHNALVSSLYLARSEAIKNSGSVTVCPRGSKTSLQCSTNWDNGWLVFADRTQLSNETTANVDADDEIVNVVEGTCGSGRIHGYGSSNRTAAGATPRNFLRYNDRGSTNWRNGSFVICDDRGSSSSRAVNIVLTGDIRRGFPAGSDNTVPQDVFGVDVTCTPRS